MRGAVTEGPEVRPRQAQRKRRPSGEAEDAFEILGGLLGGKLPPEMTTPEGGQESVPPHNADRPLSVPRLAMAAAAVSDFLTSKPHVPASRLCVELDTDFAWKTECNSRRAADLIEFGNIQLTDFGGVHFKLPLM